MNNASGAALVATDAKPVVSYAINLPRPLKVDHAVSAAADAGFSRIIEPVSDGYPIPTMQVVRPYWDPDSYDAWADYDAETEKKIIITHEGATISGAHKYTFEPRIPSARLTAVENPVEGPGAVGETIRFELYKAASAPAGFTFTDPIQVYVKNAEATNLLSI